MCNRYKYEAAKAKNDYPFNELCLNKIRVHAIQTKDTICSLKLGRMLKQEIY